MAKDSSLGAWRGGLSVSALVLATLAVTLAYLTRPQGPSELLDRTVLILDADAYQPNVRVAGRMVKQALRAEALERYARAQSLRQEAARRFALAGESTPDGRRAVAANDKAARLYLALGWANYREGKGTVIIGLGRKESKLRLAEDVAVCLVGLNPTQARAEINRFVEALEEALGRPLARTCER